MPTYYELGESAFRAWFDNFVATATASGNVGVLGLSPADVTNFTTTNTNYSADVAAYTAAHDASEAATTSKNASYRAAFDLVKLWANKWQANPAVTPELKQQLGLVVRDTSPTPRPLFAPTAMSGSGNGVGTVRLRWNSNGNLPGVTYLVQSRPVGGSWSLLTASTKTRIAIANLAMVPTEFRVIAERRGLLSEPSYAVVIYAEGEGSTAFQIAA